ncbi:PAS domain-containing hybrid sensor histidine kinase/response regulator [Nevskia ramosa]|uniref:PAS domain-containing hybrid sensor histidine kinase/response regulator n=2 Tax=Nevskia ramosa TaxID=64002 RepID=UPI0003B5BD4F|nr:hybrid sensor histidine kinase/response regulator [Nevskia ramosa]
MLEVWSLFLISAIYVAVLFAIAAHGDRRAAAGSSRKPWTYSLALGVYATSWTFYGAVGRAATSGWDFLPIYLGPMLVFLFAGGLLERLIRISKRYNITSIADFIGARYGRNQRLAMFVTAVAVLGVVPYIALQLKAVAFGFELLAHSQGEVGADDHLFDNGALFVAVLLGAFAILFGTRQVVASENHHGMVLAIAFESTVKLLAFLAVGLFVCYHLYDGFGDAWSHALTRLGNQAHEQDGRWQAGFVAQTLLAAAAVLCLPRQFHVTVVENADTRDLKRARWVFPLFLLAISVFVLPIASAGLDRLSADASGDTYMLALPLSEGQGWLALIAYLGGFSAATSMVIVETIALSTMISNELVLPVLLRSRRFRLAERSDLSGLLKNIRRAAIVAIIAAAYLYYRIYSGPGSLTAIGLLSFAAVAQFAPAIVGGVLWRGGSHAGALAGLSIGFGLWLYTLLLPALLAGGDSSLLSDGLLGIGWLRPQALFGLTGLDDITHGTLWSLGGNTLAYLLTPLLFKPGLRERLQAGRFLEAPSAGRAARASATKIAATVGDLVALLERFFGAERARTELEMHARRLGRPEPKPDDRVSSEQARHIEHLLSGALGASSARLVLGSALGGRDMQLEDVISLLDETAHEIQFNRELLRASLEHLSQGVSVVDKDLCLVGWNRRYLEMLDYPDDLIKVGRPIAEVFRYNAERGLLGPGEVGPQVERRLAHLRAGTPNSHERLMPDGRVIEVRGSPMSGGGYVTSYSDVTAYKQAQQALEVVNEQLEERVSERTAALEEARGVAERANRAKSRFLATVTHDLVQPLNAARLFVTSIDRDAVPVETARIVGQVESSLHAAENLIGALLDISRLDAAAQPVRREHFPVDRVLAPLANEFSALAQARGLEFRYVASSAIVETDPALLRRILQNFLSNAVRYTRSGCVLLGCRRLPGGLEIGVWDTGPGIPAGRQPEIFEEFRRLEAGQDFDQGLGLGLSIADRLSKLLHHRLSLRSTVGRGSRFSIEVPFGDRSSIAPLRPAPVTRSTDRLHGRLVFCLDNEQSTLDALGALLTRWGCRVIVARNASEAYACFGPDAEVPDLALIDFHLGEGASGIAVMAELRQRWGVAVPAIVLTADPTVAARNAASAAGLARLPKPVKPAALRALMSRMIRIQSPDIVEADGDAQSSSATSD